MTKYYLNKHFTDEQPEEGDNHSYLYVVVSTFPNYFVFGSYKDENKAKKKYYDYIAGLSGVNNWCEDNYEEYDCPSKEECKERLKDPDFHDDYQIFHFVIVKVVVGTIFDFSYWVVDGWFPNHDIKWLNPGGHTSIIKSVLEGKEWRLKNNCENVGFGNISCVINHLIFDE